MMCNSPSNVVKVNQESEHGDSFWRGVVMSDPDACVFIVDGQGAICAINDAGAAFFGFTSPEEVMGKMLGDLMPQKTAAERLAILDRVLSTDNPMIVHEMWDGVRAKTHIFPMSRTVDGQRRALVIIRGAAAPPRRAGSMAVQSNTFEIFEASHLDMGPLKDLTDREIEVLGLIGRGLTTAQIAKHIHRSVKTVEWHRSSLGEKLQVKNRVQLATLAIKAGFVERCRRDDLPSGFAN